MQDLLKASLVWDGGETTLPLEMGAPRDDQMLGTPTERLIEAGGRVCYDSCGTGRPSFSGNGKEGFHEHIRKVGHLSVLEHATATFTVRQSPESSSFDTVDGESFSTALRLAVGQRPGVVCLPTANGLGRVTVNLRAVLEWDRWSVELGLEARAVKQLGDALLRGFSRLVPNLGLVCVDADRGYSAFLLLPALPSSPHEEWVSLFLRMSRGCSHELVRHGDFSAISHRSTRYVDELESEWVEHPLLTAYKASLPDADVDGVSHDCEYRVSESQQLYGELVEKLQAWAMANGMDKVTARKQARGAARGYLGNALSTEMIFSASVWQWRNILKQRGSDAADAEIRQLALGDGDPEYPSILRALKGSRYGNRFKDMATAPSTTGVGVCLVCG